MFSPNRLLTPKEQALLLGVTLAVLIGSAAIWWASRQGATAETVAIERPSTPAPKPATPVSAKPATTSPPAAVAPPAVVTEQPATVLAAPAPAEPASPAEIAVAVRGGVRRQGLYRLAPDSRVADLIMKAGGATPEADLSEINLAARLMDGTTLTVPVGAKITEQDGRISGHGSQHRAAANPAAYLAGTAMPEATGPTPGHIGTHAGDGTANDTPAPSTKSKESASSGAGLIDLNTATQAELESLPGIGPVLADRIIEQRQTQPFKSVDELDNVPGIGQKKLEAVRSLVTVE